MVVLRKVLQAFALIAPLYLGALANPEVEVDGTYEAILHEGKAKGVLLGRSAVDPGLLSLDKRQQCLSGYGTCPGGNACSCPTSGANCCGGICKYLAQTCCQGYICDAEEGCCGGANSNRCYPLNVGAQCCFDGRYCLAGSICVRRNGESTARCQYSSGGGGGGGSGEGETSSVRTSTSTRGYTATTSYTGSSGGNDYSLYTVTFTIYYYLYEYYSTEIRGVTTATISSVTTDFTSTAVVLSTSATDSYDARTLLSDSASDIESSLSSSAESASSSMESEIEAFSSGRSTSSRNRASTSTFNGDNRGDSSGGGGSSRASQLRVSDGTAFILASAVIGIVGSLMVIL